MRCKCCILYLSLKQTNGYESSVWDRQVCNYCGNRGIFGVGVRNAVDLRRLWCMARQRFFAPAPLPYLRYGGFDYLFFFGTPREGGLIFKKLWRGWLRSTLYLLVCFLLPSLIELAVGYFFDAQFNTCLWSYEHMPCHIGGYVCLPFSLGWTALLFVFMRWIFPLLKRGIGKLPKWLCNALAILLTVFILLDTFTQAAALTSYDFSFCAPYDCIFRENRVQ